MRLGMLLAAVGALLALTAAAMVADSRRSAWQVVLGPPTEPANRVPVAEFWFEVRDHGWDFTSDEGLFADLAMGLRDAGLAGLIEMWGRKSVAPMRDGRRPKPPLQRIEAGYWQHHEIEGLRLAVRGGEEGLARPQVDNSLLRTCRASGCPAEVAGVLYEDVHLNYLQALDWLQLEASRYRGLSPRPSGDANS